MADRGSVECLVDTVASARGGLDIMVANAGVMDRMPFLEMTDGFWHRVLGTNLYGTFLCGQCAARRMVAQRAPASSDTGGLFRCETGE